MPGGVLQAHKFKVSFRGAVWLIGQGLPGRPAWEGSECASWESRCGWRCSWTLWSRPNWRLHDGCSLAFLQRKGGGESSELERIPCKLCPLSPSGPPRPAPPRLHLSTASITWLFLPLLLLLSLWGPGGETARGISLPVTSLCATLPTLQSPSPMIPRALPTVQRCP